MAGVRRFRWLIVIGAVFLGYLGYICWTIYQTPQPGRDSPSQLASAVESSLTERDQDELNELFDPDTVADDFSNRFIAQMPTRSEKLDVSVALVEKPSGVSATITRGAVSTCVVWTILHSDDRYTLSGIPSLRRPGCS